MTKVTIAIDAMSGDHGVEATVPAALQVLAKYPELELILVGDIAIIEKQLALAMGKKASQSSCDTAQSLKPDRLHLHQASEVVAMDELPSKALRNKKDSSMRVAVNLVKAGKAEACVSSGNTGALMATAHFVLKTLSGIDRPAIVGVLPTYHIGQVVRVLDLGANVDSSPKNLYEFAIMGSVLAKTLGNIENPRVALLNVGSEEIKGNSLVKETALLLAKSPHMNYVGFIEGDAVFRGEADVVVCDGFVGNITLKTIEGAAKLIFHHAKKAFTHNLFAKFAALVAIPVLKKLARTFDPERYNGANFIGLRGIVVKSHGSAKQMAFACAIEEAIRSVEKNVVGKITEEVGSIIN